MVRDLLVFIYLNRLYFRIIFMLALGRHVVAAFIEVVFYYSLNVLVACSPAY